jgi:RNA polymerase sigma factor (sigma-70 family)
MLRQPRLPDPDQEFLTRTLAGDTRAFDELVLKYGSRLYGLVYGMTHHAEDTRDLLQEIFTCAYQSLAAFQGESTFYSWLYQISINRTLNFLKKRKRRKVFINSDVQLDREGQGAILVDHGHVANPERLQRIRELHHRLESAIRKLSPPHRTVVTLFDLQNLSHGEISELLKVPEGTVRSRLHYAHVQLQSSLRDTWEDRF